ncbi:hypothetical protein UMC2_33661 [[Clostridium] sordellii]|uniref:hypothetical protein n=1 Tax=Paraclostridium sordellii TaxID=1505 RepID=UPI000543C12E|nr:hypothetical protein [Paeniclostridium sordellii]CEK36496.1 hypothetical protein UMC2_33661 [[Clostridium] sordellii] [Paeniclostridium sordellii]
MIENKYEVIWKPKRLEKSKVEFVSEGLSLQGALEFSRWLLSENVVYVRREKTARIR